MQGPHHAARALLPALAAILGAVLIAQPARAQASSEYKLTDEGSWFRTKAPAPGSDEALIADARRLLAQEQPERAREILTDFLDRNEKTNNPFLAAAYLLRADAKLAMDEEWASLFDYEIVARQFPQSEEFLIALEREYDIAVRYLEGLQRRLLGVRLLPAADDGVELLIRIQERVPGSALAERAAIRLADYYFEARDMALAAEAYDLYLLNYPRGPNRVKALTGRILANLAQFKAPLYDTTMLVDAREQVRQFRAELPAEAERRGLDRELIGRIDESLAQQTLLAAQWHLDREELAAGRYVLRRLVVRHAGTAAANEALAILTERGWLEQPAPSDPPPAPESEAAP